MRRRNRSPRSRLWPTTGRGSRRRSCRRMIRRPPRVPWRRPRSKRPGRGRVPSEARPRYRRSVAVGYGRLTMPVTVAARPSSTVAAAIPPPGRPRSGIRSPSETSSAVQRSPERCTSASVPRTRTSRHSVVTPGATRRSWTTGSRGPSMLTASTRRRGAPHARPTTPVTRTRIPAFIDASARARYSSIAAVPSSTMVRRREPSRREVATVRVPSTMTRLPSRWRARAIDRRGTATAAAEARGDPDAPGEAPGDADEAAVLRMSARSRTQRRYPSSAPLREARWPTIPVRVTVAPLRSTDVSNPADASAMTRSDVPSVLRSVRAMSPLVARLAPAVIVPMTRARRPSVASARACPSSARWRREAPRCR